MKFPLRVTAWAAATLLSLAAAHAEMVVTPWIPIFKGVDRAVGTNYADGTIPRLQVVNCVRVDLSDPGVQLFPTPRHSNYIAESSETASMSVSNFLKRYGLKVAVNAGFYWSYCCGGSNPNAEGVAAEVFGLSMSQGQVVSAADGPPPNDSNPRAASLMFTTNKQPIFAYRNYAPGTNTTGIYSAVSGYYPVLSDGENIGDAAQFEYPDNSYHSAQPRTAIGVSEDRRYLFLMTIDGRQNHSQGAIDYETAAWLFQFGAWDGITMDGGGSTSMYMADCSGNPLALNKSSQLQISPYRERIIGSHLGIFAEPLDSFISHVSSVGGSTTATITWTTPSNATSQVEYGKTTSYGTFSPLDSTLATNHTVELGGLNPGTRYYFRVLSSADDTQHSSACPNSFTTTNFASGVLVGITQNWRYSTNNLESINWQASAFNDSGWSNGLAPMWADSRNPVPNNGVPNLPGGTRMPINPATTYSFVTYYLRTPFVYTNSLSGIALISSNYIDDGAVFYLNGSEVFRTNMPAGQIFNSTAASSNACPPNNNAVCPLVFNLSGSAINNLVVGTNIFAVELHNIAANSADATYEGALLYTLPPPVVLPPFFTNVVVVPGETNATLTWTTLSNSTSQVQYGTTTNLGSATAVDPNLIRNHAMVVSGLEPLTQYYFRLVSTVGTNQYATNGVFTTVAFEAPLVTLSNIWRFTTNALDGTGWMARDYDDSDSGWLGSGPALFFIENNPDVFPRSTLLPPGINGPAFPTYYFRTHFTYTGPVAGYALLFTSFIDDGAVFYLNGKEIQRLRMAASPATVVYATQASACASNSCDATFEAPDVFRIGGDWMTNIVAGDNVLSAEVHQFDTNDSDVVFGSTLSLVRASAAETKLRIVQSANTVCLSWDADFLTLQRAATFTGSNTWEDISGPVRTSPYCITNPTATTFYRLRN